MRKIVLGILTVLLMAGCVSLDCPVNNTVFCVYKLQKPDGSPDTLGVDTLKVWSPRVDGKDTVLVNRLCGSKATNFNVQVSHTQPMDLICLGLVDTLGIEWLDTIRIYKTNSPHFESVDCKPTYFHTLTEVSNTNNIIDTVIINKKEIDYDTSTAHILLRLKVRY